MQTKLKKQKFNIKYPSLSFDDLIEQKENIRTNNGCIHYLYSNGNCIFL